MELSDLVGRMVAAALEQATGKTFIIDNRGGAGGNIGMEYAAHSEPDGDVTAPSPRPDPDWGYGESLRSERKWNLLV